MQARILIDNIAPEGLCGEWGLSIYIEYDGGRYLLDTGASGRFAENAEKMGIDLSAVDYGVLSHAHYDHGDGLAAFFALNDHASFYLRSSARENCYRGGKPWGKYIGLRRGTLERYQDRLVYVDGVHELAPGAYLVGHDTPDLAQIGKKADMYVKDGFFRHPDDFSHEQSLVFETDRGLVIFSSCSHGGVGNILQEASRALPGRPIRALIGGFHLFETKDDEVRALGEQLQASGLELIVTGHCTGQKAFDILHDILAERVLQMSSGMELRL